MFSEIFKLFHNCHEVIAQRKKLMLLVQLKLYVYSQSGGLGGEPSVQACKAPGAACSFENSAVQTGLSAPKLLQANTPLEGRTLKHPMSLKKLKAFLPHLKKKKNLQA